MGRTESVRVPKPTIELLRKLKEEQGILMGEAIRIAVDKYYGKKNSK